MGGPGRLRPQVTAILEAAEVDAVGRRLDNYVGGELPHTPPSQRSSTLSRLYWGVFKRVRSGGVLPTRDQPPWAAAAAAVDAAGPA